MHLPPPGSPLSKEQMPQWPGPPFPLVTVFAALDSTWMDRPSWMGKRQGQSPNCVFSDSV